MAICRELKDSLDIPQPVRAFARQHLRDEASHIRRARQGIQAYTSSYSWLGRIYSNLTFLPIVRVAARMAFEREPDRETRMMIKANEGYWDIRRDYASRGLRWCCSAAGASPLWEHLFRLALGNNSDR
jgi:hypothetical protein